MSDELECQNVADTLENVRFNALRNALYHTARRRFMEKWSRFFNFVIVLLGAAAVGDLFSYIGISQVIVGMVVALVAALQLVYDFSGKAHDHRVLQKSYYLLLSETHEITGPKITDIARWHGKISMISAEESPTLRAVDAKAYNDAVDSMDMSKDQRVHIPMYMRIFRNVFSFEGYSFKKIVERN